MLNSLDILIGFTVVMLVVSMSVTMITQFIGSSIMNLRGKSLHEGLSRLLALMDQGLSRKQAQKIAAYVLKNPLVSSSRSFFGRYRLASVIHREELTKLLLDYAVPGDAAKADPQKHDDDDSLRHALRASLARNGIADPDAVLSRVRGAVVELEKTNPELSQSMRSNIALLNFAASDFLSKLNSWFDQTVDRTSEMFTRRIRLVTGLVGLAVALTIQLDAIGLMNRLSVDDKLRDQLVVTALQHSSEWAKVVQAPATTDPGTSDSNAMSPVAAADTNMAAATDGNAAAAIAPPSTTHAAPSAAAPPSAGVDVSPLITARRNIEDLGAVPLPQSWRQWVQAWRQPAGEGRGKEFRWPFLFGILLSAALLSLGAPFWYSTLANLLKLRSVIAQKDETQRNERQTTQAAGPDPATGSGGLPPALAGGEAGDLGALG
jgi:hypothetical protein